MSEGILVHPATDTQGRVVSSPNPQDADSAFKIDGFLGQWASGGAEAQESTPFKFQDSAGTDIVIDLVGVAHAYFQNAKVGEYLRLEVVDVDNVTGLGAGAVLANFGLRFYVSPNGVITGLLPETPSKKTLNAGLYLRLRYTSPASVGQASNVDYVVNLAYRV